jgi:serine/threonine protein kinase/tetratricopeptide (TPR) repeat protein
MPNGSVDEIEVFNSARGISSPHERANYLQQACRGDADALQRILELLRAHDQKKQVLEPAGGSSFATVSGPSIGEQPGAVIGSYKLLQQIGEGGMGTVFMAEQTQPVHRTVALKIIKPGMDSRQVIARFEAERQALALMDHPHIAKVLDGGTTNSGRPYFVMELVKGVPITKYCDEHHLTPKQRLELFMPVCQALQHAHQKGIIHRDLKPSNVLVAEYDDKPTAKVIDFGVAKAMGSKLTDRTMFTELGQVVGTLEYMSPEQAQFNALDIDTRSDIYALAVLLYELLTGTTPFQRNRLRQVAFDEMLRIIREEEPQKPSTRLSESKDALTSISALRHTEPAKLTRLMRGDLDWIVMKCLQKDRNRRYETANALAMEIQRYLHDEPVLAGPPSWTYKFRKFARKHRKAIALAAGFIVLLILGVVITSWQAVRATLAEEKATRERDRADGNFKLARDAVDRYFAKVSDDPALKGFGLEDLRKDFLLQTKEFYERLLRDQPEELGLQADLGNGYANLAEVYRLEGRSQESEALLLQAIGVYEKLVNQFPDEPKYQHHLAMHYSGLGSLYQDIGRPDKAEAPSHQAVAIAEKLIRENPTSPDRAILLARSYSRLARLENSRGNMKGILDWTGKGMRVLQPALEKEPNHAVALPEFRDLRTGSNVAQARLGNHAQAAKDGSEMAKEKGLTPVDIYNVACIYSRCAESAEKDVNLSSASRVELTEQYTHQAMDFLRQAIAKGFKSVPALRTDPDLDSLRKRDDFNKLLRELTASK